MWGHLDMLRGETPGRRYDVLLVKFFKVKRTNNSEIQCEPPGSKKFSKWVQLPFTQCYRHSAGGDQICTSGGAEVKVNVNYINYELLQNL